MPELQLFVPQDAKVPDLDNYDWVLVNTSAGKDSQAMLDYLVELADSQGVDRGKLIAVHCDLGRVEWEGTRELAGEQAAHYGLRFEVVRNRNWADLLERIESRGKWPDAKNRYAPSLLTGGGPRPSSSVTPSGTTRYPYQVTQTETPTRLCGRPVPWW